MNPSIYVRSGGTLVDINLPDYKVLLVVFLALITAFGIVYIKDCNRKLFIEQGRLHSQYEQLQAQHNKLLLEQSAWAAQERVQMVAQRELAMQIPLSADVQVIKA